MPAIEAADLGRRFGQRWAIRHLDFAAAEGEVLGFLGPNGAGKTTTLRILTGQLAPTEGRARVADLDVASERARLGGLIGVTFDRQNLYERLTARENLAFFARLAGVEGARVTELLREAELLERADEPVGRLSRGMRQRLLLARALLGRPRVLFLDEPTAGLDPHAARQVRGWARGLAENGATVFLTTHDMEEAAAACDRVIILHQGAIIAEGPPRELVRRHAPPRLRVTLRNGSDGVRVVELPVEPNEATRELARLQAEGDLVEIAEASSNLEAVFLQLTGEHLGP